MKLRRNEYCPIHRSPFCCGREQSKMERRLRLGVQRIEDPHHPRGYRELRSPAGMRKFAKPKDLRTGRKVRNLPEGVLGLQRHRTGPQTDIRRVWVELGEMTIRTTFKPRIGGATTKRDQ